MYRSTRNYWKTNFFAFSFFFLSLKEMCKLMSMLVVNVKQLKRFGSRRGRQRSEVKKCRLSLPEFFRCEVNVVVVLTEHAESPHPLAPELIFFILSFDHCCRTTVIWKDPAAVLPAEQASLQLHYINHATNGNKIKKVWMQHFARCIAPIKERPPCSITYWGF